MQEELKRCTRCDAEKPLSAFVRHKRRAGGVDNECRRCRRARESTPQARQQARVRALRQYGMTPADYSLMSEQQGHRCAICRQPETRRNTYGEPMPLVVDHDHKTGKVRGLLCGACNTALGKLGDSPHVALRATAYLTRNGGCLEMPSD